MTILQDDLHLLPRGEIVWQKGEGASGSCAWGSFRSAANPVLRDVTERVIVASKGRFGRARSPKERRRDGPAPREQRRGRRLHGADARRVGHPARERGAGAAPRALPGRAAPAPHGALHLSRRSRGRPLRRLRLHARGGAALRARRRRATTSTPPTSSCPARRLADERRAEGAAGARRARRGDGHLGRRRWPGPRSRPPGSPTCGPNRRLRGLGLAVDFTGTRRHGPHVVLRRGRAELGLPGRHGALRDGLAGPRPGPRAWPPTRPRALRRAHDAAAPGRHRGRPRPAGARDPAASSTRSTCCRPTPGSGSTAYAGGRCGLTPGRVLVGRRRGAGRRLTVGAV